MNNRTDLEFAKNVTSHLLRFLLFDSEIPKIGAIFLWNTGSLPTCTTEDLKPMLWGSGNQRESPSLWQLRSPVHDLLVVQKLEAAEDLGGVESSSGQRKTTG